MSLNIARTKFIGRKREIEVYKKFLQQETPWLFLLAGMPGTGKSTLLDYLEDHAAGGTLHIKLDFANRSLPTDPLKILEALSWRLAANCVQETVDAFDDALRNARRKSAQHSFEIVASFAELNLTQPLGDLKTQIESKEQDATHAEQRLFTEVEAAFYKQIQTFNRSEGALVLIFDTCEWLNEIEDIQNSNWVTNSLIPQLHTYLHCHILIASRTYPQMKKVAQQDQLMYPLPMLDQEAVVDYLREIGVEDEQDQEKIFRVTHGHPLCLSIISTLWQVRDEREKVFDEPFQKEYTEQALVELVQDRLDLRLRSPDREWTHYGVLLRRFNWEFIQYIFPELLDLPDVYGSFEQFSSYSYIKDIGERYYEIHELFREVLVENIHRQEPDKWQLYHQRAFNYCANRSDPEQYYYAFALDDHKGIVAWQQQIKQAENEESIRHLLTIPRDNALQISKFGQGIYHYAWGDEARKNGEPERALKQYQQALISLQEAGEPGYAARLAQTIGDMQEKELEQGSIALEYYKQARQIFHDLDDSRNEGFVLQASGHIQRRGQEEEARQSYEQALGLFRQISDRLNEAHVLRDLGQHSSQREEEWPEALNYYNQAEIIFHELGETHNEASTLQAKGDLKRLQRKTLYSRIPRNQQHIRRPAPQGWRDAVNDYGKSLVLYRTSGDTQSIINIQQSIGEIYQQHKRPDQAVEQYTEALVLIKTLNTGSAKERGQREATLCEKIALADESKQKRHDAQKNYQHALELFNRINDSQNASRMFQAIKRTQPLAWWGKRLFVWIVVLIILAMAIPLTILYYQNSVSSSPCLVGLMPPHTIGVTDTLATCGQESIGVSDGEYAFDSGQGNTDTDNKSLAASQQRAQHLVAAKTFWENAYAAAPTDAEPLIYAENVRVLQTPRPHITLVVTTSLTPTNGIFTGGGRDIIQGAYLGQKAYNDHCLSAQQSCKPLLILVANIGSNPDYAPFVTQQIINIVHQDHTIIGVLGFLNSAPTLAVIPLLQAAQIPLVSSTATSDRLTGISPYFFRVIPTDTQQGTYAADYAQKKLNAHNIAVFSDPNDAYSDSLAKAFEKHFSTPGHKIIETPTYTIGNTNGLLNQVNSVLTAHPDLDLIYFAGYARDASPVLLNLESQHATTRLMGGDALFIPGDYTQAAKNSNFKNLYFTSFTYIDPHNAKQSAFLKFYQTTYDPHNTNPQTYGSSLADSDVILSYDATNTYLQGYQNALAADPTAITPDRVRTGLSEIDSEYAYKGISGIIAFASDGNPVNKQVIMLHGGQNINNLQILGR